MESLLAIRGQQFRLDSRGSCSFVQGQRGAVEGAGFPWEVPGLLEDFLQIIHPRGGKQAAKDDDAAASSINRQPLVDDLAAGASDATVGDEHCVWHSVLGEEAECFLRCVGMLDCCPFEKLVEEPCVRILKVVLSCLVGESEHKDDGLDARRNDRIRVNWGAHYRSQFTDLWFVYVERGGQVFLFEMNK